MSDEKIKLWFETQREGEEAKTLGIKIEPDATEEQIREAFGVAADAAVRTLRPRCAHVPVSVKVTA